MGMIPSSLIIVFAFSLTGCGDNLRTIDPEEIAEDFSQNRDQATVKYRSVWGNKNDGISSIDRVTIAGELMAADPQNYTEYYSYVAEALQSRDAKLASAAANSMRNARGSEAISSLLSAVSSNEAIVARASAHALAFKLQVATHGGADQDELSLLREGIDSKCKDRATVEYVREVICTPRR